MLKSYFTIAARNLMREQTYSLINVGGLAIGIAVALLIGVWVNDELSFNKQQENYHTVAAVMQNNTVDGKVETWSSQSYQLGLELRAHYGNYFKHIAMCSFPASSILQHDKKVFSLTGCFMEAEAPEVLSLNMIHGTRTTLKDTHSILLSSSVARSFFGDENPVGKLFRLDNDIDLKVGGVYQDIPDNSSFRGEFAFIAPLEVLVNRGGRNIGWVNNWL